MEYIQFNCQYLKYIFLEIAFARSPLSTNSMLQSPIKNQTLNQEAISLSPNYSNEGN